MPSITTRDGTRDLLQGLGAAATVRSSFSTMAGRSAATTGTRR